MVVRSTVPQSIFYTSSQLKKETTSSADSSIKKKGMNEQEKPIRYIPCGTARGMCIFYVFFFVSNNSFSHPSAHFAIKSHNIEK